MYDHVLSPIQIGGVTVKNRVVRTAHGTAIGGGTMSDDLIAYHAARARGGVGLTIIEILGVHPSSPAPLNMFDPTLDEGYAKLMAEVGPTGMTVFQQIWHAGHNASPLDGSPPWAPSDIASPTSGIVPIPMTKGMIDEIVEAYAAAAVRCEAAGLHGVEVHCAHGYLVQQFLSPNANRRTDEYGGSFENRARFLMEVMRAVRAATGPNFAVGARLSPDGASGGVHLEDNQSVIPLLEEEGLVDFINVSQGSYYAFPKMIGGMHEPVGYEMELSEQITRIATVPTMVTGRVRTLEEADQIIRTGGADLCGMTRAHIADPDIVIKTQEGREQEVRPCIACNQGCVGNLLGPAGRMGCVVNPGVGFERSVGDDHIGTADEAKKVLIIGGGPAGMEAARVAALRGHQVTLAEATPELGGMVNFAAKLPKRHGIADHTIWLEAEIYRLGVDVRLSTYLEADDVAAFGADHVIVATGSSPRMDGVQVTNPGLPAQHMNQTHVLSSVDLLTHGRNQIGKTAVVVDDVGHYEALGIAEYLQENGASVTMVTSRKALGTEVESALMVDPALERLDNGNFTLLTRQRLASVGEEDAVIGTTYEGGIEKTVDAETVVFISANKANRDLYVELEAAGVNVAVIGDANSPRFMQVAVREGHLAAKAI